MAIHRAVAITAISCLEVIELPTPVPEADEVLVHVHYTALIPYDGYELDRGYALSASDLPRVVGFAGSGLVKAVGKSVKDLKEGDRVATFNISQSKNKAAQEYAVVPRWQVAKIPESVSLHEAASIPDNYLTAMYVVFGGPNLAIPVPSSLVPSSSAPLRAAVDLSAPVLVYGAGSSVGQFLVQAFRLAGFTNIFVTASSHHHAYLRTLGASQCFDYRSPDVVAEVRAAVARTRHGYFTMAVDPIAARGSLIPLVAMLGAPAGLPPARLAILLAYKDGETVTNGAEGAMYRTPPSWLVEALAVKRIETVQVSAFRAGEDPFTRDTVLPLILSRLLEEGRIRANPVRLMKEGSLLDRVNAGLDLLRNNKISGEKVVVDLQE
ncbi:zinc-binding alcohol dehydrogenase family protein [Phanerochaete sordida]|uniref:Zinc-binding alcohol dehydrogenase family protein n=1 Tax=Phanerochaete sordida TaxID=48140 RepID=A0A9P3GFC5_9APHY|nr:zinc-binding alcohol dehydrogenase family protein [Phanerochaete sordida]